MILATLESHQEKLEDERLNNFRKLFPWKKTGEEEEEEEEKEEEEEEEEEEEDPSRWSVSSKINWHWLVLSFATSFFLGYNSIKRFNERFRRSLSTVSIYLIGSGKCLERGWTRFCLRKADSY